jgi:hypothetical protein
MDNEKKADERPKIGKYPFSDGNTFESAPTQEKIDMREFYFVRLRL